MVAEEGIDRYVDFLRRVGAPLTLSEAGVPDDPASLDSTPIAGEAGGSFVQIHRDDARDSRGMQGTGVVLTVDLIP